MVDLKEEINMPLLNRSIISKLNQMYETLDEIREIWIVHENKKLLNELGESMDHIGNALDIIKNRDKPKNEK
jgi:hypothetical protein